MITGYMYLAAAIFFELCGTTCMKVSEGYKNKLATVLIFVFYGISFSIFPLALQTIDVSIAYAIWSGVGTAAITVIGIYYFKEPATAIKMISIFVVMLGVAGLNLSDKLA
ncbi:small multidrug resistance pump [Methanohalophilus levihalophilus]|uniref:DMT family transporter n=1 Tax=Methanohalophilus levihalophilus TaxID=1431282 RepID=UPI001AEBA033|nr:multidrug efflux SMR transporter [Methanohalophilus levihalophilus]MBP2029599.1 small multidrug resistance pump [Methanohalophilus levihalophilus]